MTFSAVGSFVSSTGVSTLSITPHTAGNFFLITVGNGSNNTVSCTSLSSSNATWTPLTASFAGTVQGQTVRTFIGIVTAASTATVTASWSGTAPSQINIAGHEFSSSLGASSVILDVQGHVDSSGTNTWASLTPNAAGELYFGWCTDSGTATAGSTTGYVYGSDSNGNGVAYNLSCTSAAPVWGDSGMVFGQMVVVQERTWSVIQSAATPATSGNAGTTLSVTYGSNVSAGTKLICYIGASQTASFTITSVKDAAGNAMTQVGFLDSPSGTGHSVAGAIYAMDTPAGDVGTKPVITVILSAPTTSYSLLVQEVSGLAVGNTLAAMVDGTAASAAFAAGASDAQPAYSSTAAGEFLVALCADNGGPQTVTQPAGYTIDPNAVTNNSFADVAPAYRNSTGGAETGTWTFTGTTTGTVLMVVAFKLPSALPVITTVSLPSGAIGDSYDVDLVAAGGITPYTWSISSGSLPGWASLNTSTGAITGTVTGTPVSTSFTVEVTDDVSNTATQPLSITTYYSLNLGSAVPGIPAPSLFVPGLLVTSSSAVQYTETLDTAVNASGALSRAAGRVLAATVFVTVVIVRHAGKILSPAVNVTASMTRNTGRILPSVMNAAGTVLAPVTRLEILSAAVDITASLLRSTGKILPATVQVTGTVTRSIGKIVTTTINVTGTMIRSLGKNLAAVVLVITTVVRSRLMILSAAVNATAAVIRSLGKILGAVIQGAGSNSSSIGKICSSAVYATASLVHSAGKILLATVNVTGTLTAIRVKLLALSATVNITGTLKMGISKTVGAVVNVTSSVTNGLGKILAAAVQASAVLLRSAGKVLPGTVNITGMLTAIRVKLLSLPAAVNVTGTMKMSTGKIMSAAVNITSGVTNSVSKIFSGTVQASASLIRSLGKILSGTVKAASSITVLKVALLVLTAAVHVTATQAVRISKTVAAQVAAVTSESLRAGKNLAAAVRVTASAIRARAVILMTAVQAVGSILANVLRPVGLILFKLGLPAKQWITGTIKKNWRIP